MILNGHYQLYFRHVFGAHHDNLNEYKPVLSATKNGPMTSLCYPKLAAWCLCGFSRDSLGRGRQTTVGCRKRRFSVLSLGISSETRDNANIIASSTFPKQVTLNDLEPFTLNSDFTPVCWACEIVAFENSCLQTNKDSRILSATQMFSNRDEIDRKVDDLTCSWQVDAIESGPLSTPVEYKSCNYSEWKRRAGRRGVNVASVRWSPVSLPLCRPSWRRCCWWWWRCWPQLSFSVTEWHPKLMMHCPNNSENGGFEP